MRFFRLIVIVAGLSGMVACTSMESLVSVPRNHGAAVVEQYDIATHERSVHTFNPVDLGARVESLVMEPRVSNVVLILDQNTANNDFGGVPRDSYLREMARRFLKTVPSGAFELAVVYIDPALDKPLSEISWHQSTAAALTELEGPPSYASSSGSSVADVLEAVYRISNRQPGGVSIVLFSEWSKLDSSVSRVIERLAQYANFGSGELIQNQPSAWRYELKNQPSCVHLVGLGNRMSRSNGTMASCGVARAASAVSQPGDMAAFVELILFGEPKDSDSDGIFDYMDKCPSTDPDRIVDFSGCLKFTEWVNSK